ncbi:hypothetical protein VNO77_34391 [Canavalia gladiata]|uniref:Uncharacterized protein n=1 Tax=Canavalia gladiata TaxID=3824 RepID=A0AAN9Q1R3_CANGL
MHVCVFTNNLAFFVITTSCMLSFLIPWSNYHGDAAPDARLSRESLPKKETWYDVGVKLEGESWCLQMCMKKEKLYVNVPYTYCGGLLSLHASYHVLLSEYSSLRMKEAQKYGSRSARGIPVHESLLSILAWLEESCSLARVAHISVVANMEPSTPQSARGLIAQCFTLRKVVVLVALNMGDEDPLGYMNFETPNASLNMLGPGHLSKASRKSRGDRASSCKGMYAHQGAKPRGTIQASITRVKLSLMLHGEVFLACKKPAS